MDDKSYAARQKADIEKIAKTWEPIFATPLNYFFLDSFYNEQYAADELVGRLFILFSVVAILIACLGLFGMISFTVQQRTKEIGIRKVLGANLGSLVIWLSSSYVVIVAIAFGLSLPVFWMGAVRWLDSFAYAIELDYWVVIIPLLIVLVISLATVLAKVIRAAQANPVKALRYE